MINLIKKIIGKPAALKVIFSNSMKSFIVAHRDVEILYVGELEECKRYVQTHEQEYL